LLFCVLLLLMLSLNSQLWVSRLKRGSKPCTSESLLI
jgi:hypothetical protein